MARLLSILNLLSVSLAFADCQGSIGDLFGKPYTRVTFKQGYSFTHYDGAAYIFGGSEGNGNRLFSLANS
jgi:hypothetical protein